jgi:hypothetical protein
MITSTTNNQDQYNIALGNSQNKNMVLANKKAANVPTHISDMVSVSLAAHHTVRWITVSVCPPHMIYSAGQWAFRSSLVVFGRKDSQRLGGAGRNGDGDGVVGGMGMVRMVMSAQMQRGCTRRCLFSSTRVGPRLDSEGPAMTSWKWSRMMSSQISFRRLWNVCSSFDDSFDLEQNGLGTPPNGITPPYRGTPPDGGTPLERGARCRRNGRCEKAHSSSPHTTNRARWRAPMPRHSNTATVWGDTERGARSRQNGRCEKAHCSSPYRKSG